MINVNCLNNIASVGLDLFSSDYNANAAFEEADAVLVRSAKMHDMELPDNLLAIARAGAGVNNIPLDKCADKGIVVFNTPGANANAVKEHVLAALLLASLNAFLAHWPVIIYAAFLFFIRFIGTSAKNCDAPP